MALFEKSYKISLRLLRYELLTKTYNHEGYTSFSIRDPKPRNINKATVRDRILHHALFVVLYKIFDKFFIYDSYASRVDKGTHQAVKRLRQFAVKVGKNNTRSCFVLKCDIKKFFDSIDQDILLKLLQKRITDRNTLWLVAKIIRSFKKGIPLGNVTSQIFANVYLNELDQFLKRRLKIKHYIRYCDDFVIVSEDEGYLYEIIHKIDEFLQERLKLILHPHKISIRKYHQGIDFLGYVVFPHHIVMRPKTKQRMFKKVALAISEFKEESISAESLDQTLLSYFGILGHANSFDLSNQLVDFIVEKLTE